MSYGFSYQYQEPRDPFVGVDEATAQVDPEGYTTHEYQGHSGESEAILERICAAIDERERDSRRPVKVVVLGRAEYVAVDAWLRYDTNDEVSLEEYLPEYTIVTVPGRMIHVPQDNQRAIVSHLKETHDD